MSSLTIAASASLDNQSLDELLIEMCRYGEPLMAKHNTGWWCRVEMHIASVGASFKVDSKSNHSTPLAAAIECKQRIDEALAKFGAAVA